MLLTADEVRLANWISEIGEDPAYYEWQWVRLTGEHLTRAQFHGIETVVDLWDNMLRAHCDGYPAAACAMHDTYKLWAEDGLPA